ncbi:MAG: GerW family sporulation protein [Lachnospiraceae bacterium]|nr:GerW family sporulation protein [Lachnospiraceae bacterium]
MSDHKENRFQSIIESMMDNAQAVLSTKTVVGEPIKVDDTIIIPLSDVTIGCAAGSNNASEKDAGLGGLSAKISPTAVLVIRDKVTKVVSIKDQNTVNKLLEMVPDVIDRFALRKKGGMMDDDTAVELAFPEKASEDTE